MAIQHLYGNWRHGWALDLHTISSRRLPYGGWATTYTDLGDMLHQFKYRQAQQFLDPLADAAAEYMRSRFITAQIDAIIPVPPSDLARAFQPVQELAVRIGQRLSIPVAAWLLEKTTMTPLIKNIQELAQRREVLRDAFRVRDRSLAGKYVLLFDDLFDSGETAKEITRVLYEQGGVARVYLLTITKTRATW